MNFRNWVTRLFKPHKEEKEELDEFDQQFKVFYDLGIFKDDEFCTYQMIKEYYFSLPPEKRK